MTNKCTTENYIATQHTQKEQKVEKEQSAEGEESTIIVVICASKYTRINISQLHKILYQVNNLQ